MDNPNDSERRKDEEPSQNGLHVKDEQFWQNTTTILASTIISDDLKNKDGNEINGQPHPENVFYVHCKCLKCLNYRQLIQGIFAENTAYNTLWNKLQDIIKSYYSFMPADQDTAMDRKYNELITDSCGIKWFSDGSIDFKKNLHVSMGSNNFSLSNEMTFIIVFNMLYTRDRHQLFELLCLQLTSIVLAYREGVKEITKCEESNYDAEELLNFILNGFDRITEIAETLTPLVIEMRDHLQKFSLTWLLMNQCMYYRFLYLDIESRMADCILRLKDTVDNETYKQYVYRFIKFDEQMTTVSQSWDVALVELDVFRKFTQEQIGRIERIGLIRSIFMTLNDLNIPETPLEDTKELDDQVLTMDWIVTSEKNDVWMNVMNNIKKYCRSHKSPCNCWACLMIDTNGLPNSALDVLDNMPTASSILKDYKTGQGEYHLAWSIFKHLKDRKPYKKQFVHPEIFCVFNDPPCDRIECLVATNIIVGSYPLDFSKCLIKTYHKLTEDEREKYLQIPMQSIIKKYSLLKTDQTAPPAEPLSDSNLMLLLNMYWDTGETENALRNGLAAALAEKYKIDVKFPHKHIIYSYFYALFRTDPVANDIVLDLQWLEQINLANLFKSFGTISNTLQNDDCPTDAHSVETIEMTLNELKITAEVNIGSDVSDTLDLVQFSMKDVADKFSSISLTEDDASAKSVIENEIKKPLVEALKLAASNKKLEAELKSLQKEHNMLKDMVKGLEQIHGEKKEVQANVATINATKTVEPVEQSPVIQIEPECLPVLKVNSQLKVKQEQAPAKCGHSHPPSTSSTSSSVDHDHEHHSGSGSGGADCVCYYCTLFGKNQDVPLNTRTTETRDRLRKRLHHLQNDKDFPATTTKSSNSLKDIQMLHKNLNAAVTQHVQKKKAAKCTEPHTAKHKCGANGNGLKMKVEMEMQQRKKKTVLKAPTECCKIQRETEHNLKSIENLMEYIEGAPPVHRGYQLQVKKRAEELAERKQLKKLKQQQSKMQRQYDQRIQELRNLDGKIQSADMEERQILNQLSQLRKVKAKSRDPKKIKIVEDKVKEATNKKKLLEEEAVELVKTIETINPDFEAYYDCGELSNVLLLLPDPDPPTILVAKPPPVQRKATPPTAKQVQQTLQNVQVQNVSPQQPPPGPSKEEKVTEDPDPAKRMVTIRRINLPHSEPQVTVTAKGNTPDMDQLLYTFVNGQLVPASSLSASALQANGSIQLFMSSNNSAPSKVETVQKNNKMKQAPPPVVEEVEEPEPVKVIKKDKKKLKEVIKESQKVVKNEPKVKDKVKIKEVIEKPKKLKKPAFIDPEFSNNAFGMLDDENHSESEESESEEEIEDIPVEEEKVVVPKEVKKVKEETKAVKKQLSSSVSPVMSKTALKKEQRKKDQMIRENSTASSQASVPECQPSVPVKLSKKQKKAENKKLKMEQQPTASPSPSLSASATSTFLEQNYIQAQKQTPPGSSASIMDQLSRGIRVEGLRLPPGITLTKVTPNAVDSHITARKESIAKITQPMSSVPQHQRAMDENLVITQSKDPNGVIMVESAPYANNPHLNKNKNKKKKKANKAEAAAGESKQDQHQNQQQQQQQHQQQQQQRQQNSAPGAERMVTLRNPMFGQSGPEQQATMTPIMRNSQPTPPFTLPEPQTASIFKNENGMYTIRNPAFQNAFFSPPTPTPAVSINPAPYNRMNTNSYAPFGESSMNHNLGTSSPVNPSTSTFNPAPTPPASSSSVSSTQPKCNSAIGSEMKNVLQRRKEQEFQAGLENNFKYGAVGTPPRSHSEQGYSHFGDKNIVNSGNYMMNFNNSGGCEQNDNVFMSQPGPNFHQQSYPLIPNYDDLRLQPGQHLNSEVTIHNVSESKFFQKGIAPPMVNSIGITRINGNGMQNGMFNDMEMRGKAPQQQRSEINGNESVFVPNQKMNLNELESDDRDIETFKRFDYYFEPPKNKLKVNINVKDIVVNPTPLPKKISTMAGEVDFEKKPNSTNSNSPSSLTSASVDLTSDCASSLDEFYENGHPQQKSPYFVPQQNYDRSKLFGNDI